MKDIVDGMMHNKQGFLLCRYLAGSVFLKPELLLHKVNKAGNIFYKGFTAAAQFSLCQLKIILQSFFHYKSSKVNRVGQVF